jgi:hypothetical protein
MNKYRVRILKAPQEDMEQMKYGGQQGFGLDIGSRRIYTDYTPDQYASAGNTLGPVPRDEANIEAEKGETVFGDIDQDGELEQFNIAGQKHVNGGTPLNVPKGSFIFSDTKKMKIKDPELLKSFGINKFSKGGITPAQIAKRYNLNTYKTIANDPKSDELRKNTARMMMEKNADKLGKLAFYQEAMKGFPQGVPAVAANYAASLGFPVQPSDDYQEQDNDIMAYGGIPTHFLPKALNGVEVPDWYKQAAFTAAKTPQGAVSRKNRKSTLYTGTQDDYSDYDYWRERHGSDFNNMADYQKYVYDQYKMHDPEGYNQLVGEYGEGNQGLYDSKRGVRTQTAERFRPKELERLEGKSELKPLSTVAPEGAAPVKLPLNQNAGLPPAEASNFTNQSKTPFSYLTPDKWAFAKALMDKAGQPYVTPYLSPLELQTADPNFLDWRGEVAANQGVLNQAMQANYLAGDPTKARLLNSELYGKAAPVMAQIIGNTNNANAQIANAFAQANAEVANKNRMYNAQRMDKLNELFGNVKQSKWEEDMALNNNLLKAASKMWYDRSYMNQMNENNPYYYTDPKTGKIMWKGQGKDIKQGASTANPDYASLKAEYEKMYGPISSEDDKKNFYAYVNSKLGVTNQGRSAYGTSTRQRGTTRDLNGDGVPDNYAGYLPYMLPGMTGN